VLAPQNEQGGDPKNTQPRENTKGIWFERRTRRKNPLVSCWVRAKKKVLGGLGGLSNEPGGEGRGEETATYGGLVCWNKEKRPKDEKCRWGAGTKKSASKKKKKKKKPKNTPKKWAQNGVLEQMKIGVGSCRGTSRKPLRIKKSGGFK